MNFDTKIEEVANINGCWNWEDDEYELNFFKEELVLMGIDTYDKLNSRKVTVTPSHPDEDGVDMILFYGMTFRFS